MSNFTGVFNVGKSISLIADEAPEGHVFNSWVVEYGDVSVDEDGIFLMPSLNVRIRSSYVESSGIDTDGDGVDDEFDDDIDGDGVANESDNFPSDSDRASGNDTDGDGVDDEFDTSYAVLITSLNGSVSGGGQKTVGSTVTLSAAPNTGYNLSGWTVNDGGVTIFNNSFTMPDNDVSITANYTIDEHACFSGWSTEAEHLFLQWDDPTDIRYQSNEIMHHNPTTNLNLSEKYMASTFALYNISIPYQEALINPSNNELQDIKTNWFDNGYFDGSVANWCVRINNQNPNTSELWEDTEIGDVFYFPQLSVLSSFFKPSTWNLNLVVGNYLVRDKISIIKNQSTYQLVVLSCLDNPLGDNTVTVDGDNGIETGGGTYNVEDTVTLSATPDSGYTFDSWTVNSGGVTIVNDSFVMPDESVSITANYTAIDYAVTVDGDNGTQGGGGTYNVGDTVTLSATPDSGYIFDGWTINSGGVTIVNDSFVMPDENVSITANYSINTGEFEFIAVNNNVSFFDTYEGTETTNPSAIELNGFDECVKISELQSGPYKLSVNINSISSGFGKIILSSRNQGDSSSYLFSDFNLGLGGGAGVKEQTFTATEGVYELKIQGSNAPTFTFTNFKLEKL